MDYYATRLIPMLFAERHYWKKVKDIKDLEIVIKSDIHQKVISFKSNRWISRRNRISKLKYNYSK